MPPVYHVNRRLSDASNMFRWKFDPLGKYFFEEKSTDFLTDQFVQHSKANLLGLHDATPVGDDELPQEVQVVYDPDTKFTIPVYALSSPGKWMTQKNADPGLSYDETRVIGLTLAMRLMLEYIRINKTLRSTGSMTQNTTLLTAQQFDNYTSGQSMPVQFLKQQALLVANNNQGVPANRAACTSEVLNAICNSQDFRTRVQYTTIPNVTDPLKVPNGQAMLLEAMIGLAPGTLKIHDVTYNAGTLAAPSYKKFLGSDFVMGYVEPLGIMSWTMSVGWKWTGLGKDETAIASVPQYTRGAAVVDEFRILAPTLPQIIHPELGVLIKNCVNVSDPQYGGFLD